MRRESVNSGGCEMGDEDRSSERTTSRPCSYADVWPRTSLPAFVDPNGATLAKRTDACSTDTAKLVLRPGGWVPELVAPSTSRGLCQRRASRRGLAGPATDAGCLRGLLPRACAARPSWARFLRVAHFSRAARSGRSQPTNTSNRAADRHHGRLWSDSPVTLEPARLAATLDDRVSPWVRRRSRCRAMPTRRSACGFPCYPTLRRPACPSARGPCRGRGR